MLELSPLLYRVASGLDGRRQLPEIPARLAAESERSVSVDNVAYLIEHKLRPLRVLGGDGTPQSQSAAPVPLLALHLRAAVIPTSLVRAVTGFLRPVFTPVVVAFVLTGLVTVDASIILEHRVGRGARDLLYRPGLLLMVAGLTLLAAVFHELGHATASRYGGVEPGPIGVGVYLIWPVFYNDLSDSYRLDRGGRLRADLGGVYFNAVFILVMKAMYGVTGFEPLLLVVVMQHLVIIQQFLPVVRLDGYYIVSDLAGVPDLFGHIRPVLAGLIPGRRRSRSTSELRPRARHIVTAWVLITLPLLVAGEVLLAVTLPHLAQVGWSSLGIQGRSLLASVRSHHLTSALLSALQLLILVIPFLGISAVLLRAVARWLPLAVGRVRPTIVTGLTALIGLLLIAAISGVAVHRDHRVARSVERQSRLTRHVGPGAPSLLQRRPPDGQPVRRPVGYLTGGG